MSGFRIEEFRQHLCTQVLGRPCHFLTTVSSTNTTARTLGQRGAAEGTIVVADAQTAGRGQAGRVWISPPGRNLYVSVILRPTLAPAQAPLLSLLAAVALVDTLRQTEVRCSVKWPNDVLVSDRKVAGILTEMETDGVRVHFVVVGIGVNVNMTATELVHYLGPIAPSATSVQMALGHEVGRERLLAALLSHLERWYERFCADGEAMLPAAWEARSLMSGRRIVARTTEATWRGVVEGIDAAGRLQLRQDDATLVALVSAEVRFVE